MHCNVIKILFDTKKLQQLLPIKCQRQRHCKDNIVVEFDNVDVVDDIVNYCIGQIVTNALVICVATVVVVVGVAAAFETIQSIQTATSIATAITLAASGYRK